MKIKQQTVYKTSDGSFYESEDEARAQESWLQFREWYLTNEDHQLFIEDGRTMNPIDLAKWLRENIEQVTALVFHTDTDII